MTSVSDLREKIAKEISGWDVTCDEDAMFVAGRIRELVRELEVSLENANTANAVLEDQLKRGPTMPENLPQEAFLAMCHHPDGKQWMSVAIAKDFYQGIRNALMKEQTDDGHLG